MMHFFRIFSIMRAYGSRLIAIDKAGNSGKIVYIKNIFENGLWEEAYPPKFAQAISYKNYQKNLAQSQRQGGARGPVPQSKCLAPRLTSLFFEDSGFCA